ncbi:hypothetical protein QM012_008149 [Aureobasidium pullulans]|uniref:BTB domain-containing protein n=1 Tax=Aureobasidium pullulans TaxID=5580 RepID=A0ABR0TLQ0_AURPU
MSRQVYHAMRHSQSSFETGPGSDHDSDEQSIAESFLAGMALIEADMDSSLDGDGSQDLIDLPILYNVRNVVTSDVVVRFGGGRYEFLSEKAILSAKSGYFKRAFSSSFPVATSDVIDLGDEDPSKHIYAMLSFIHGTTTYRKIHQRNALGRNLDFHIDLYLIGEQFDIRSLRYAAADAFFHEAIFLSDTRYFPMAVQRILGPDAPVFADQFLAEVTTKVCIENIETLVKNEHFTEMALAGELVDEEMMTKLFFALGQRVRALSGMDQWRSKEDRLLMAQKEMMAAEAAMGPGPWDRSVAGRIMALRAQNAAHAALRNAALLVPQPTWAPPPAILASQPPAAALTPNPPPVSGSAVARSKFTLVKIMRNKVSLLKKKLCSSLRKT